MAKPEFDYLPVEDGERYSLGEVQLEFLHTPGHTPESLSIVIYEHPGDTVPYGVLTGDTLFIGDVGRPDLLASIGFTRDELADKLYDSLHNKLMPLPDATRVFPAHGAGSACGKNLSTELVSTMGEQRKNNYALRASTKELFMKLVTEGQPPAPGYFVYDAILNRKDRELLDETKVPTAMTYEQARAAMAGGAMLVDGRTPEEFAQGHLRDAVNIGLEGRYAVMFDHRGDVQMASRLTAPALSERISGVPGLQLVDVRNPGEAQAGMIAHAVNIPVGQLPDRLAELDPTKPTVVYCAGGYRSSVAASLLRQRGFADVSDLLGGYGAWEESVQNA